MKRIIIIATAAFAGPVLAKFKDQCFAKALYSKGEMYGVYLASCPPDPSNPHLQKMTELDLNNCLVNANGELKWQPGGGAFKSCKGCHSNIGVTNIITCDCPDSSGQMHTTSIDLDGEYGSLYVARDEEYGVLACFDIKGMVHKEQATYSGRRQILGA